MQVWRRKAVLLTLAALLLSLLVLLLGVPTGSILGGFANAPLTSFVFPVAYPELSSHFGRRKHPIIKVERNHSGIDLAAPIGAPIRAIAKGIVIFADPLGGYGNFVVIKHKNGLTSHYGHCEKLRVKTGKWVNAGEVIATVGSSGMSTGPHLHFEIRRDGVPLDPLKYLPGFESAPKG